jgi:hypothetical protein
MIRIPNQIHMQLTSAIATRYKNRRGSKKVQMNLNKEQQKS